MRLFSCHSSNQLNETFTRGFLPWSCTYRMMFPRTPYSGTVQGSLRVWLFSDLWNILQSADGTLRHGWLLRKARGRAESPKDRRKSRSWFFISSTWERPLTSKQAANANTSLPGGVMLCVFCLGLSTLPLFLVWIIPVHSCSAVRNNELRPGGHTEIRWKWGRRESEPGQVPRNQLCGPARLNWCVSPPFIDPSSVL